ncbi:retrovirus-related pol polyprotein from transposon TNT 1-94 [Tanacetum coccineum]
MTYRHDNVEVIHVDTAYWVNLACSSFKTKRKKHVTFAEPLETSGNNTTNHVKHPTVQKTNVPIIHSTGVSIATKARRSQSTSNKMNDKTLPANSVPEKKVEDHHRKNKSKLSKKNRVDSSTSVRRTVFDTDSNSLCKTFRPTALNRGTMPADPQGNNTPVEYNLVVQIVLWYLDSGCSKHMTGDRSRLRNFVKKFIGTVRFGNNHFGAIMGYEDYVIGDSVISRVYYVEGLGHNLFSVGQFCDSDLELAFRKHTCFVIDLDGVDIIKGSHGTNLYTISVEDMMRSSPICLLSKASKNKSWLWNRRLNHLNFGTLNDLARKDLVRDLPRLKFEKDHMCSACQLGKSRKATHKPKMVNTIMEVLHTLHMDLCGPMRVQSIKGKKYILVIADDYLRFTWVKFLRSKDETLEFVVKLLKQLQVSLNKTVRNVRTNNGTKFFNKYLTAYYESVSITHEKTVSRTPQQNGVVERQNRTLVEVARTMLIFSKAPMFLWAEAIATACYTQNRSLIHTLHNNIPYCTDKAKITRKRLKPGKNEHRNGRARKEPEELLSVINSDPNLPPSPVCEINVPEKIKSLCEDPPDLELKDLPSHLEYAFLEGDDKLPVIIAKNLKDEDKTALIKFCTHKILMEENAKPVVQHQRRVNPKIHEVIKQEVIKLLDAGLIYPISDNPWVSPVHYVPKKGGITVVKNEENELIPTRLVTGLQVYIDYQKLNDATRKDHFPLPFMDQMLERLAGNEYYCFLEVDGVFV